ncbi:cercosporin resistance protein [Fusarium heterosporum]|uniref:Cercosporin resistance protein n=1 Tax=Fusarium heterosporum TaxID=42747 RepID=A0A8H5WHN4_FUSHE|nr:cercosporin resistance protein [Fusarium heterosporum]
MTSRSEDIPLLKTCQTCFNAKIRCEKSQNSGKCDRCLRLNKTCVFNPSRRRKTLKPGPSRALEAASPTRSRSPSLVSANAAPANWTDSSPAFANTPSSIDTEASHNPFTRGLLSLEKGQELLDVFRIRMSPHFPFVVVRETIPIQELVQDKPALCVAILAASSHEDLRLQQELGKLFNELVVVRMMKGPFASLDMLQGLLVHLACSAVLLQKSHHFRYSPFILECCHKLLSEGTSPSDKHLPYIIYLQKLTEEVDDAVIEATGAIHGSRQDRLPAELNRIRDRYTNTKASLPFPLSESPTILLQLHVLELIICQPSPDGVSYGPGGFQSLQKGTDQGRLLDWLSQSMTAAKSLISVILLLPQGDEDTMPNIGWIMLYCAVSLAVRLDLVAAQPENTQSAGHLRRILDMPHTLRQIVLRMEATSGQNTAYGEADPYYGLARRARHIERWYLERCAPAESPEMGSLFASNETSPSNPFTTAEMGLTPSSFHEPGMIPSVHLTSEAEESWMTSLLADMDNDPGMESLLFTGPFDFLGDRQI